MSIISRKYYVLWKPAIFGSWILADVIGLQMNKLMLVMTVGEYKSCNINM